MGCEVVNLNSSPSGDFKHPCEPLKENLTELMAEVKKHHADVGIAHDGDGDRMMAVDDLGRFIDGDILMRMLVYELGARNVVTTIDASMIVDECRCQVERTPVGDKYVSEALMHGGDFGGEPSGAWIFPKLSLCPDGMAAASYLVSLASRDGISELVRAIPRYPILRSSIATADHDIAYYENQMVSKLKPVKISRVDGLKLYFSDAWLLLRPSGTEPKVRLTVEAQEMNRALALQNAVLELIQRGSK